ncbi:MAG: hypothetical protein AAF703_11860 [Cyanobacteria bacterium P01_D01_bin.105]
MASSNITSNFSASQGEQAFYSSLVVEHIVAKQQTVAFTHWCRALTQTAEHQPGFVRLDQCPPLPCEDDVVKWYTIAHFDSPQHLNDWIASKEREHLLKSGQRIIRAYRFKSFTTGLEGWFSRQKDSREQVSLGPAAWKQILAVVFGLYPLVMIRIKLLPTIGVIGSWSPAGEMLLTTLVTSSILGLVVMPFVTRLMRFWLYPAYRPSMIKTDVLGCVLVALSLVSMTAIFDYL